MARLKLNLPNNHIFETTIAVRINDINYGNHVGNDAFVSMLHEARVQWLKANNFTELNIEGVGLIMSALAVEYKNESFYGDKILVEIFCGDITKVAFELYYQLSTQKNNEKIILVNAKTEMVCYEYTAKKVAAVPKCLLQIL